MRDTKTANGELGHVRASLWLSEPVGFWEADQTSCSIHDGLTGVQVRMLRALLGSGRSMLLSSSLPNLRQILQATD